MFRDIIGGVWYWALVGGTPSNDYVTYQLNAGSGSVFVGGVEMYAGIGGPIDPTTPDPATITDWFLVGGSNPTPVFT